MYIYFCNFLLILFCNHSLQPVFPFACNWSVDAKEEMQRQTDGKMTEKNEYNTSANLRRRRPGILGYHQCFLLASLISICFVYWLLLLCLTFIV